MDPQEEKRRRRLLLELVQCSEPEESSNERNKFSVGSPPTIKVVDDSDNENDAEETEAVTPARPLQLLLSPMSSVTNALGSMQFSEQQRIGSSLSANQLDVPSPLSPERNNYRSPTKNTAGVEDSPDTTIKSNLVSPDHEGEIPVFDLSPYKTPTKRADSPEPGLGLRKFQAAQRSRSLSCDRDFMGFKAILEKVENQRDRIPFKDLTNKFAVATDALAIPKKRKLKKPTAESPPLRRSYSCLAEEASAPTDQTWEKPQDDFACAPQPHQHHSSSLLRRTVSMGSVDGECFGDFGPRTCLLPTIRGSHPDLNCIDPKTVVDLIEGRFNCYDEVIIIDCRFDYEYKGGHVKTARNMTKKEEIEEYFMKQPLVDRRICIIFYCEFSSKRGPTGYRNLRDLDRKANEHAYPNLYYPEVYLMEGGYKNFYNNCRNHCDPIAYVEMKDPRFCLDMKENVKSLRQSSWKRSRSLTFNNRDAIKQFF